jgi:hypothetical protein
MSRFAGVFGFDQCARPAEPARNLTLNEAKPCTIEH